MLQQALDAPDLQGALVTSIQDDAGTMIQGKVMAGDIVRSFNGQPIPDPRALARKAAQAPIGSDAALELWRRGAMVTVHVTIHAWPEAKPMLLNNNGPRTLGLQLASARGENGQPIVTVASVDPDGSAADSGIQKGDIIVEVQQTTISEPDQALQLLTSQSAQKHRVAAVLVERDKKLTWMPLAVPEERAP